MKKILLFVALALTVRVASAQETANTPVKARTRFSIGIEAGIPTGDASDALGAFLGGTAKVELPVASSFFVTGSAGYTAGIYKEEIRDAFDVSFGAIPVKVGGKYFFGKNFYGAAELGAAFAAGDNEGTAFVWAPGVGASFPVSAKNDIDFGVRYESWENEGSISQVGFHVALKF